MILIDRLFFFISDRSHLYLINIIDHIFNIDHSNDIFFNAENGTLGMLSQVLQIILPGVDTK